MSPTDFAPLVERLDEYYVRRLGTDGRARHCIEFARKLGRFDRALVTRAVDRHMDASDRYPVPNQLLALCRELEDEAERRARPRPTHEERGGPLTPLRDLLPRLKILRDDRRDEGAA